MMAGKQSLCAEDIHNLPSIMRNLDVQQLSDDRCLTVKERCYLCFSQGSGDHWHIEYRHLQTRRGTFRGRSIHGLSPDSLAETGLFLTSTGNLTCYECGQTLRLQAGEDPLAKHVDMYPNCKHVCKVLQKRPRSAIATLTSPSARSVIRRRRLFSE